MHERAKSISNAISYALSNLLHFNVKFLSRELWQEEDEGRTQIAFIEDDKGERYKITLAVAKTARVEQTVPVSTSDDYTFSHPADNGIDHQDTDHAVGRFNTD